MGVLRPQIPRDVLTSNVRQADQYLQGGDTGRPEISGDVRASNVRQADQYLQGGGIEATDPEGCSWLYMR